MQDPDSRLTAKQSAMTSAKTTPASKTEQVLELYLEKLESGQQPDRKRFLAEFPEIAEELSGQLEAIEFLHLTAPQLSEADQALDSDDVSAHATLGDFQLIKPLGRGGMGVVYEAVQLSLGRRVALKVLPFAAMLDSKRLKRFRNESRAAASLEHPHIVPVYFVGQERGVHFYAMQMIEGQSLAEVVADLHSALPKNRILSRPSLSSNSAERQDFYRTVAELGTQAADALQHAHQQGVVHRDIKPGNLLVDWSGKLWVTDFGLARLETHESSTAGGDILGTVAYMSPEQMSSEANTDARTDLYSLGATLYEVIAGKRPFYQRDDPLNSFTRVEADAPSLRRFDPHVPRDLQTILLTAMSRDPADRYLTAAAMADDLRNFAEGRSIRARPLALSERLVRWARKHPQAVATSSLLGMALIIVSGLSTAFIWRAQIETRNALTMSQQRAEQVAELLYLSDMERAFQAWESRRLDHARTVLQEQVPDDGANDHRGIEWHLLSSLVQPSKVQVLGRHEGSANQLAVFPDGRRVASVGEDRNLRIWDIESGSASRTIEMENSNDEPLFSVAISPDGETVATGSDVVQLWDPQSGRLIRELTKFSYNVQSISFSPGGRRIAAASRYDRIRLLEVSGKLLGELEDGSRHESLEFTRDGKAILVPCREVVSDEVIGIVREWNSDLSEVRTEFLVEDPGVFPDYTLATSSPDGKFYALSIRYGPGSTRLVDAETGELLLQLPVHRDGVNATAFSPNGKFLAAAFNDGTIEYWLLERLKTGDFVNPEQTHTLHAHQGKVHSLKFASDRQLVSCGTDGMVKVWPIDDSRVPMRTGSWSSFGLAASPDGQFLAYADSSGIKFLPAEGGEVDREILFSNCDPNTIAFSKDGRYVAATSSDDSVVICRTSGQGSISKLTLSGPPSVVSFSPTSNQLAAITRSGTVSLWEVNTKKSINELSLNPKSTGAASCCCYSPDGRFLLGGGSFGDLVVMDANNLAITKRIAVPSNIVQIAFEPTGGLLATAHKDGIIRIWDWPSGQQRSELVGHSSSVDRLAFSPDGRTLASNSGDKTTRLWAPFKGRSFGVLYRHETQPTGLAFSADGRFLYVGRNRRDSYLPGILVFPYFQSPSVSTLE